ncbi:MAG: DNA alkylation repair protein [Candidatus Pacearchaeota archaeon]|jgi:3-methyladenine DNA glycosylase AlkD
MVYKSKKQLKKLNDKEFFEDIKKYIKSTHTFFEARLPELKVLAKRLHEEYDLKDFYKVFNRLWKSGYPEERTLAVHTLELYKEEFDIETWKNLKPKLKEIKSWDKLDKISKDIIGEILLRKDIKDDLIKMSNSKDNWFIRMAIVANIPLIKKNDNLFAMKLINQHINSKEEAIQKANGWILKEISEKDPEIVKTFILKNKNMPLVTFNKATENLKDLRKIKSIKKLKDNAFSRVFFWKDN